MSEQDQQEHAAEESLKDSESDGTQESTEKEAEPQEGKETDAEDWRKNFDADKASERIKKYQSENINLRNRAKEAEKKAEGSDEKDSKISAQEATILRYEVAFDLGLPKELAARLQGNDRDEMLKDAQSLLELVSNGKRPPSKRPAENLRGGGEPEREPEETDLSKIGARMFKH